MKKYALHPGYVTSKSDGERHYISGVRLAQLYQLHPHEYIIWEGRGAYGRNEEDYHHLWPDYDGNYGRPDVAQ